MLVNDDGSESGPLSSSLSRKSNGDEESKEQRSFPNGIQHMRTEKEGRKLAVDQGFEESVDANGPTREDDDEDGPPLNMRV